MALVGVLLASQRTGCGPGGSRLSGTTAAMVTCASRVTTRGPGVPDTTTRKDTCNAEGILHHRSGKCAACGDPPPLVHRRSGRRDARLWAQQDQDARHHRRTPLPQGRRLTSRPPGMGRRVRQQTRRRQRVGCGMTGRARANGEGSIFPYKNGSAAYAWITTPAGQRQRKYVYGKTREDVHAKWIKLQGQARQGVVATRVPTVHDFLTYWLEEGVRPNRAPMTYATYESHVRLHLTPMLGKKRLDKLTVRDIQTGLNQLRHTCQCCSQEWDAKRPEKKRRCCAVGKCCQSLPSDKSVSGVRAVLRSALTHAMAEELISRNVAMTVKLPSRRKRKRG